MEPEFFLYLIMNFNKFILIYIIKWGLGIGDWGLGVWGGGGWGGAPPPQPPAQPTKQPHTNGKRLINLL